MKFYDHEFIASYAYDALFSIFEHQWRAQGWRMVQITIIPPTAGDRRSYRAMLEREGSLKVRCYGDNDAITSYPASDAQIREEEQEEQEPKTQRPEYCEVYGGACPFFGGKGVVVAKVREALKMADILQNILDDPRGRVDAMCLSKKVYQALRAALGECDD